MVDGVFEEVKGDGVAGAVFHPANNIDAETVTQVQASLRRRILPNATGGGAHGPALSGNAIASPPEPAPPKRAAHCLWAVLIARIYEAFPLVCPLCGGQMRIIAFITHSADIRHILYHIGADSEPPHISPARGPPLWDGVDAPDDVSW